ncbi:MAG: tyrosine--tRNA ligase [Minisyncoccia bacterium]
MKIDTDEKKIDEILNRGIENIYPNREFLKKKLLSGERQTIYLGIDPTGPSLHIGHSIPIRKLTELQKLGHKVILLIGDFTATIGDPDKLSLRVPLTRKEVLNNCKNYKKQASRFLKFGFRGAELKYNSKWLAKMNLEKVLELASKMTVDQMLKRDMYQKRITEGRPIHIHEFMYPLMQGYDSIAMDVDGEIGGNDQMFNMLAGRDLVKEVLNKEKFVITTKLLADANGDKMGKTTGNMISLECEPFDMFGKVMSWTDGMILSGFELCTDVSTEKIKEMKERMERGENPRDIKIILAKEMVSLYFNKQEADKAEENFINTFKKGGLPENLEEIKVSVGDFLGKTLVSAKIVSSNTDFRRLINEGAVSDAVSGEKIDKFDFKIEKEIVVKVGKKRFIKITI